MRMILVSLALLLAACAAEAPDVAEIPNDAADEVVLECPECPSCPDCICPTSQPTVAAGTVDLTLGDIELRRTELRQREPINYRYSEMEYDDLEKATLRFEPRCSDEQEIEIEVDNEIVYSGTPPCRDVTEVDVPIDVLNDGRNTIYFISSPDEEFQVQDIVLSSEFAGGLTDEQDLFAVRFNKVDADGELFTDFARIELTNVREVEFELEDDEADEDYLLRFEGVEQDGTLVILVNDEQVYTGNVNRRANELMIPAEKLKEGTNYVTFIARFG